MSYRKRIDRIAFAVALAKRDMSMKELGELTGLSRSTLTSVKSGKSCAVGTYCKIAKVLGEDILVDNPQA